MDLNLVEEVLKEYRRATELLLECLGEDDYDSLEKYINKREVLINKLKTLSYTKEELTKIYLDLNLGELQNRVDELMVIKNKYLREEIGNLARSKSANKSYNKGFSVDAIYFNKQI